MKFTFQAGQQFDMLTPDEMEEFIGRLDKTMKGIAAAQMDQKNAVRAEGTNIVGGAVTNDPTTGLPLIKLAPNVGYRWDVRRIAVTGQSPGTPLAGATAEIYRNDPSPLNYVWTLPTVPGFDTWSLEEFSMEASEKVCILVRGAAASAGIFVNLQAVEFPPVNRVEFLRTLEAGN